jgi:hypothetical protein
VSSINASAKKSVDMHYELFCSKPDADKDLCDSASATPNADLEAHVFLYPTGFPAQTTKYRTLYTYSPVESLASYQYIKTLTGTLYMTAPSSVDMKNSSSAKYVAGYRQLVAALSISTNALLSISQAREPVNRSGALMSELDVVNYLIEKSKMPETARVVKSSSQKGQLIELQKQMALAQRIKFMILTQKDWQRMLEAADLAIDSTLIAIE